MVASQAARLASRSRELSPSISPRETMASREPCGAEENRTLYLLTASQTLSQMSYSPGISLSRWILSAGKGARGYFNSGDLSRTFFAPLAFLPFAPLPAVAALPALERPGVAAVSAFLRPRVPPAPALLGLLVDGRFVAAAMDGPSGPGLGATRSLTTRSIAGCSSKGEGSLTAAASCGVGGCAVGRRPRSSATSSAGAATALGTRPLCATFEASSAIRLRTRSRASFTASLCAIARSSETPCARLLSAPTWFP